MELWMQPASARSGQGECQQQLVDRPGTARTATGTEDACQRPAHTQHLAGSVATAAQKLHVVPQHATPAPCHPTAAAASHMQAASSQKRVAQHLMQHSVHSVRSMRRTQPGSPMGMGTPCSKPWAMRAAKRARKSRLGPAGQATPAQGILGHTCGQHDPLTPRDCNAEPQAPRARRPAACHVANPFAWTPEPSPPLEPTAPTAPSHLAGPAAAAPAAGMPWTGPWGLPPPPTTTAPDPGRAFLLHALLPRPLFQAQPTPAILATACPLAPAAPLGLAGPPAGLLGPAALGGAGLPAGLLGADALARLTSGAYVAAAPRAARRLVFDGPDAAAADAGAADADAAAAAPIATLADGERAVSPSPRAMWCGTGGDLSPAASRCSAAAAAPAAPRPAVSAVPEPVPEPEPCTPVGPRPQAATATLFDPTEAHTLDQLRGPQRTHTPLMRHWGAGSPAGAGLLPVPRAPQKQPPQLDSFLGLGLRVRVAHKPLPPAELRITPALLGSPASCC